MEDRVRGSAAGEHPVGEWARSETRDLADAARQHVHETKEYAAGAKEYVRGAVQQTKEYVEGAREYVGDAVQQARDKVTHEVTKYRDGGMEKVRHDVVGYTREQPMTALLIAAGAGLVLGWLSVAGRR